ncbi:Tn3 family transposase [Escherichia coli]|uniref:Tn3 family transposase n=1 Tax=Escherichia coli TaxID=562 RepID=UPI001EEE257B|nr:Tn3 family transposase [Enterobacter hormaechei]
MNKTKGCLIANFATVPNTVYLERATQGLVEAGKPVDGELLQFLSPLGWEHINLTGDYVWRQSRRLEDGKFRPLRMPGKP